MEICTLPILPRNWVDPILRAAAARVLVAQPHHILLAVGAKAEGGHLLARLMPGTPADILTLFIRDDHRRTGHARRLLKSLFAAAGAAKCPSVTMEVRASNNAARRLYETSGFVVANTRPAYYSAPVEDAIVYTLNLS